MPDSVPLYLNDFGVQPATRPRRGRSNERQGVLPAGFATAAAATTTAAAAVGLRPGFIHIERATSQILAVQGLDGTVGFPGVGHLDEGKASGAARVAVRHQADFLNSSIRREEGADRLFSGAKIQITYENILQPCLLVI